MSQLSWDVFVAPELALVDDDLPPGLSTRPWGPTSATLITGREDAVLVDALLTTAQATALAGWIEASGRNLTTVYVTHGHGDHFFGLPIILDRFLRAKAVAMPGAIEVMREQPSQSAMTIDELVEVDALIRTPLPIEATGAQKLKEVFGRLHRAYPDLHVTVEDVITEGDKVVGRNTVTGTHQASTWACRQRANPSRTTRSSSSASRAAESWRPGAMPFRRA